MNQKKPNQEEKQQQRKKALNVHSIASRILKREDNIFKMDTIQEVIMMYFDECQKALENGEIVKLSQIGSLSPRVHAPRTYNVWYMNAEDGNNPPYTAVHFTRGSINKQKMNYRYLQNIRKGIAGLGDNCMCNSMQKNILIEKGLLKPLSTNEDQ